MITETTRQAYLKAMGVQVYFPRTVLAGAKPSPQYEFTDPEPIQDEPVERVTEPMRPMRSKNPDRPVIDVSGPSKRAKSRLAKEELPQKHVFRHQASPSAEEKAEESSLRFDLGYQLVADGVAVLYELPPVAKDEDKARAKALLAAILRACGFDEAYTAARAGDGFSWPLPNDLGLASNDKAGAAALMGFLRSRCDGDQLTELIVFAGVIEPLLSKIGEELTYRQTLLASLSAMLSLASLKREVWTELQPTLARIKQNA